MGMSDFKIIHASFLNIKKYRTQPNNAVAFNIIARAINNYCQTDLDVALVVHAVICYCTLNYIPNPQKDSSQKTNGTWSKIPYITDMQACPDICTHLPANRPTVQASATNEHHSQYNTTSKTRQLI